MAQADPRAVLESLSALLAEEHAQSMTCAALPPLPAFGGEAGTELLAAVAAASTVAAPAPAGAAGAAATAALELRVGMTLSPLPADRLTTAAAFSAVLRGDAPEEAPQRRAARANLTLQGIYAGEGDS